MLHPIFEVLQKWFNWLILFNKNKFYIHKVLKYLPFEDESKNIAFKFGTWLEIKCHHTQTSSFERSILAFSYQTLLIKLKIN